MSFVPEHFTVWAEIPSTDVSKAMAFYSKVFDLELSLDESGPNPMVMFPSRDDTSVAGHIYPGTPATGGAGPTVHFAAPDTLEATLDRVKAAGGEVVSDVITIPAGRFAYCHDVDGNSIGVFARASR